MPGSAELAVRGFRMLLILRSASLEARLEG